MPKIVLPAAQWENLIAMMRAACPEIFDESGNVLNCFAGQWQNTGQPKPILSPIDGSQLGNLPMLTGAQATDAVQKAQQEFITWSDLSLNERKAKVAAAIEALKAHRDLIAYLLAWEIGKPVRQARVSVDRCNSGVEWYLQEIDQMTEGRAPLGLVSNIASWNYPLSVLIHAMLVQALCGNSVVAKVPTDGGLYTLSFAVALCRKHGLPFTLVSGSGGELSHALIQSPEVAALNYVGGKSHSRSIAESLMETPKRYMLEMEGLNTYGIWNYSNWPALAAQMKKGYEYGKQRCTAYVRWVVQRDLFPQFLETYLSVVKSLQIGHPLLVEEGASEAPDLDFGPVINAKKASELNAMIQDAFTKGAIPIYHGVPNPDMFLPEQDKSAYLLPVGLIAVPKSAQLYHNEPFGPVDTIVLVDSEAELITEMNVSNGNLVSSIATDDVRWAETIVEDMRAFKIGINKVRSRGDRAEIFGGFGNSWRGCFVGGEYLVRAITKGQPDEVLFGNFRYGLNVPDAADMLVQVG